MGIKIVSQPIGSPIIAAASTAMAQANQRTAERQSEMWRQQVANKYRSAERNAEQLFKTAEDDFQFSRKLAMAPVPLGVQGNLRAATSYGKLQDEARNIYSGLTIDPRSDEAQKRLQEIASDMAMLREVNPDPTPAERYDKNRVIVGPDGGTTKPDGTPYTATDPGAKAIIIDDSGRPIKDPSADAAEKATKAAEDAAAKLAKEQLAKAQKQITDANTRTQKRYDVQRKRAEDAVKRKEKALLDNEKTTQAEVDALWSEFDSKWPLESPDLIPMPDAAPTGIPAGAPTEAPAEVPGSAVTPIPIATPGIQGPGPASMPVPISTPGSQGPGSAVTPTPIATPGAATPEAMGWDISEWTPEEADIALDKIVAEMEKNGVRYDQLDPATKARFDALVRQKGGV